MVLKVASHYLMCSFICIDVLKQLSIVAKQWKCTYILSNLSLFVSCTLGDLVAYLPRTFCALTSLLPCTLCVLVSHVSLALYALVPHVPFVFHALMSQVPSVWCALLPHLTSFVSDVSCPTYSHLSHISCFRVSCLFWFWFSSYLSFFFVVFFQPGLRLITTICNFCWKNVISIVFCIYKWSKTPGSINL